MTFDVIILLLQSLKLNFFIRQDLFLRLSEHQYGLNGTCQALVQVRRNRKTEKYLNYPVYPLLLFSVHHNVWTASRWRSVRNRLFVILNLGSRLQNGDLGTKAIAFLKSRVRKLPSPQSREHNLCYINELCKRGPELSFLGTLQVLMQSIMLANRSRKNSFICSDHRKVSTYS